MCNPRPRRFLCMAGGSSSHAEEKMANAARDAGVTKTIVRANVDKKGKPPNSRKCR